MEGVFGDDWVLVQAALGVEVRALLDQVEREVDLLKKASLLVVVLTLSDRWVALVDLDRKAYSVILVRIPIFDHVEEVFVFNIRTKPVPEHVPIAVCNWYVAVPEVADLAIPKWDFVVNALCVLPMPNRKNHIKVTR